MWLCEMSALQDELVSDSGLRFLSLPVGRFLVMSTNDLDLSEEESYDRATLPARTALADLLEACPLAISPSANSLATAELAEQASLTKVGSVWWQEPVRTAQAFGVMTLSAALDFATSFLVVTGPTVKVALSPAVLARASIESATRSHWLLDPAIDARERVARGINERLADAHSKRDLPADLAEYAQEARTKVKEIERIAGELGYVVEASAKGKPRFIRPGRKSMAQLMVRLMGPGSEGLAKALINQLGSVTHASGSGISSYILETIPSNEPPFMLAKVGFKDSDLWLLAQAVGWAIGVAGDAHQTLYGHRSEAWITAHENFKHAMVNHRAQKPRSRNR